MENEKVMEMLAKIYDNMTDDQKKRAVECETKEDFMAIVENEGVELPDDMFDDVAGGANVMNASRHNASTINQMTMNQSVQNASVLNQSMSNISVLNQAAINSSVNNQSVKNQSVNNSSVKNQVVKTFGSDLSSFLNNR